MDPGSAELSLTVAVEFRALKISEKVPEIIPIRLVPSPAEINPLVPPLMSEVLLIPVEGDESAWVPDVPDAKSKFLVSVVDGLLKVNVPLGRTVKAEVLLEAPAAVVIFTVVAPLERLVGTLAWIDVSDQLRMSDGVTAVDPNVTVPVADPNVLPEMVTVY